MCDEGMIILKEMQLEKIYDMFIIHFRTLIVCVGYDIYLDRENK